MSSEDWVKQKTDCGDHGTFNDDTLVCDCEDGYTAWELTADGVVHYCLLPAPSDRNTSGFSFSQFLSELPASVLIMFGVLLVFILKCIVQKTCLRNRNDDSKKSKKKKKNKKKNRKSKDGKSKDHSSRKHHSHSHSHHHHRQHRSNAAMAQSAPSWMYDESDRRNHNKSLRGHHKSKHNRHGRRNVRNGGLQNTGGSMIPPLSVSMGGGLGLPPSPNLSASMPIPGALDSSSSFSSSYGASNMAGSMPLNSRSVNSLYSSAISDSDCDSSMSTVLGGGGSSMCFSPVPHHDSPNSLLSQSLGSPGSVLSVGAISSMADVPEV